MIVKPGSWRVAQLVLTPVVTHLISLDLQLRIHCLSPVWCLDSQ